MPARWPVMAATVYSLLRFCGPTAAFVSSVRSATSQSAFLCPSRYGAPRWCRSVQSSSPRDTDAMSTRKRRPVLAQRFGAKPSKDNKEGTSGVRTPPTPAQGFSAKASKDRKHEQSRIPKPSQPCPCFSGKPYGDCCKPFHDGKKLPQPQQLMRARYAAYASVMPDFIMGTTHPQHADYGRRGWRQELLKFCHAYRFTGLVVDEPETDPTTPEKVYVYFTAMMAGADCGQAAYFDEKSVFVLKDGVWYYREADREYEASVELISKRRYQRAARMDKPKGLSSS